jgi:Ca2+-binding RTX toxin-like protein
MFASTFETLESRRLFAAVPPVATVVEAGGVVDVTGTKKADDIHVRLNADGVTLEVAHNGVVIGSYAASAVSLVRVDAGKGNDNVHVDANVLVATSLNGNVGNDVLVAGGASSTMIGGNGKDSLTGSPFADVMTGDNGKDVLSGGDGNDNMNGGNGKDVVDGGAGDDMVLGGNGRDLVTGGTGFDNFADPGDKIWELVDVNASEDTYSINIDFGDLIPDFWPF